MKVSSPCRGLPRVDARGQAHIPERLDPARRAVGLASAEIGQLNGVTLSLELNIPGPRVGTHDALDLLAKPRLALAFRRRAGDRVPEPRLGSRGLIEPHFVVPQHPPAFGVRRRGGG